MYECLARTHGHGISPRLLLVDRLSHDKVVLYIEAIRRVSAWPWPDMSLSRRLLTQLARFHVAVADANEAVSDWDYDTEFGGFAVETLTMLDRCRRKPDLALLARNLSPLKRIVLARAEIRRELLTERPLGASPIHGDVHTGNVLVRRHKGSRQPVLVDWGRARPGSPLEDVSSWLHSLGAFETEARRRHDTLLAEYLSARGMKRKLDPNIRAAYWLASTCNALAGSLLYHLTVACDDAQSAVRRGVAVRNAHSYLRVVRRADAWWS